MPTWMMRGSPVVARTVAVLLVGFGVAACELAKRDFADTPATGTSGDGGAPVSGRDVSVASGETSGETTRPSGDVASTELGESNGDEPPNGDSSASSTTPTNPTGGGPNTTAPGDDSQVAPGDTTGTLSGPDHTSGERDTSDGEQSTRSLCDQNILVNGNFEAGKEDWMPSSNYTAFEQRVHPLVVPNGHASLASYAVTAHEGTQFAFLGDVPDNEYDKYHTTLTQSIFVPPDAVGLALVGQIWISTQESDEQEWDMVYIQVESREDPQAYWQFKYWSNRDASEGWVKFDAYIDVVDAVRGKDVNLVVQSLTDQGGATRFWFDDLEVVVVCSH